MGSSGLTLFGEHGVSGLVGEQELTAVSHLVALTDTCFLTDYLLITTGDLGGFEAQRSGVTLATLVGLLLWAR